MSNYLEGMFSYGSRWELFVLPKALEEYINSVIKAPDASFKNGGYGIIAQKINEKIYSVLVFKNAKLMYAAPFYLADSLFSSAQIIKAEHTKYGETFITLSAGDETIKALAVDYNVNSKLYKKDTPVYLSAIAYSFSKVDLKIEKSVKGFMKQNGFFYDEYILTSKIRDKDGLCYHALPLNSKFSSIPLYAPSIYLDAPGVNDFGAGDIFLSCYTKEFYDMIKQM
jgi:hypothetical protein